MKYSLAKRKIRWKVFHISERLFPFCIQSYIPYRNGLNRSYQELAEHYSTAIVPAKVRKVAAKKEEIAVSNSYGITRGAAYFRKGWV